MKIHEAIRKIKGFYKGNVDENKTRDQILFGDVDQECKGIVTTCFASINVIKKAISLGANLIICHEALFYNHGDRQEWLMESKNTTFLSKRKMLEHHRIVVWRNHDYIHSGLFINNQYHDGILFGLLKQLEWEDYVDGTCAIPTLLNIPKTSLKSIVEYISEKLHLNGVKYIGDKSSKISKILLFYHIWGTSNDNKLISKIQDEEIQLLIPGETVDFTVNEYIQDSSQIGFQKAMLILGHFNVEEAGMQYMITYLPDILGNNIHYTYVQSGDMYEYYINKEPVDCI
ncbi:Nif3-like dinuclear metal center hexameric protein [Amedibacillus sp. YH-ame6]